jgi:hypothetical protein
MGLTVRVAGRSYERYAGNEIATVIDKLTSLGVRTDLVAVRACFRPKQWCLPCTHRAWVAALAGGVVESLRWRGAAAGRPLPERERPVQEQGHAEEGTQGALARGVVGWVLLRPWAAVHGH